MANNILAWDSESKSYTTKPGELEARFTFYFTNVSTETVTINNAAASCGCTVPKMPPLPWKNEPGATGEIPVTMNLAGKTGMVMKTITVNTDRGRKILNVTANITPAPVVAPAPMDRNKNQELAKADRQAVFKGDCASCHGTPVSHNKAGADLYKAVCGVCHESEHRATMVPDLHALNHDTNADYWKTWISLGKPGSLMPGFAQSEGGPLNEAQINSLVQHLVRTIPSQPKRTAAGN
jgi:mono/diheme cytochrome c family protein